MSLLISCSISQFIPCYLFFNQSTLRMREAAEEYITDHEHVIIIRLLYSIAKIGDTETALVLFHIFRTARGYDI